MSGFSADWLTLREPYDLRARSREVIAAVAASVAALPSVHIVDLACGTGATVRALTAQLPSRQTWRLADNDLGLLGRANAMTLADNVKVTAVPLDLNRDLEAALDGAIDLVTTSAFLDLVSKDWLDRLTTEIAARSIPFYAALTYDGRIDITPNDPADASIVAAVNKHQATDKGFGLALGPEAAAYAIGAFERLGYAVTHRRSDWTMGPNDRDIQLEIFAGWAGAAREIGALSLADSGIVADAPARQRRRGNVVPPCRSCRSFCGTDRQALSRKIAIEQNFVVNSMHAHRHAHGLVGALDRRQRDAGPARAQNDRRDDHVQPVKATCRKEARNGVGATLDQYPTQSTGTECCKDSRRRNVPIGSGQPNKLNARDRSNGLSFRGYQDATDTVLTENPRLVAEPAVRVDDDAGRLLPGDPAYGQLRIVCYRSTDADNDCIDQSPQPVEVGQSGRPIDVF